MQCELTVDPQIGQKRRGWCLCCFSARCPGSSRIWRRDPLCPSPAHQSGGSPHKSSHLPWFRWDCSLWTERADIARGGVPPTPSKEPPSCRGTRITTNQRNKRAIELLRLQTNKHNIFRFERSRSKNTSNVLINSKNEFHPFTRNCSLV